MTVGLIMNQTFTIDPVTKTMTTITMVLAPARAGTALLMTRIKVMPGLGGDPGTGGDIHCSRAPGLRTRTLRLVRNRGSPRRPRRPLTMKRKKMILTGVITESIGTVSAITTRFINEALKGGAAVDASSPVDKVGIVV